MDVTRPGAVISSKRSSTPGNDGAVDRAELNAFDLARNRSQLARRIDLRLDPAAGVLFDGRRIALCELVQRIVDGGKRKFHQIGFFFCGLRAGEHNGEPQCRNGRAAQMPCRIC